MHYYSHYHTCRWKYLLWAVGILISGLMVRHLRPYLPGWINDYCGDMLWAMMIYNLTVLLFHKKGIISTWIISTAYCYITELSQLYHRPWIDSIRQNRLGGLILGFGFLWSDILAYTLGIALCVGIEYFFARKSELN